MARFRNDFDDGVEQYIDDATGAVAERPAVRVLPTLGYLGVRKGQEFEVPDDAWEHYEAGGFTPLTPDPRSAAAAALPPGTDRINVPTIRVPADQPVAAEQPQQQEAAPAAGGSEAA